jgi:hypothetical protein
MRRPHAILGIVRPNTTASCHPGERVTTSSNDAHGARVISVQRHWDTDRSQNGPLDFQKALGGNGSAERLAAEIVLVQRGDLLTLEHRCLRQPAVSTRQSHVGGSHQETSRARYDGDIVRELIADVG